MTFIEVNFTFIKVNVSHYGEQKILLIGKSTTHSILFFSLILEAFTIYPIDEKLEIGQNTSL